MPMDRLPTKEEFTAKLRELRQKESKKAAECLKLLEVEPKKWPKDPRCIKAFIDLANEIAAIKKSASVAPYKAYLTEIGECIDTLSRAQNAAMIEDEVQISKDLEKYGRGIDDLIPGATLDPSKNVKQLLTPPALKLDKDSKSTFRAGVKGNAFSAAVNIKTGVMYLNPVVARGAEGEGGEVATEFPEGAEAKVGGFDTVPIVHKDARMQNATSHGQLISKLAGNRLPGEAGFGPQDATGYTRSLRIRDDYLGFAVTKGTKVAKVTFTSRTLNILPKFQRPRGSGGGEGKLSDTWAEAITHALIRELGGD